MEPTQALRTVERTLRLAVREVYGTGWMQAQGAPDKERLEQRRGEETRRRDGVTSTGDLLEYTETYDLTGLIRKNWEKFKSIFDDKKRTDAYFQVVEDIRNAVAHSRELVPFEHDLISGIAGQLRNQVAIFRSSSDNAARHYPRIEGVTDNFGTKGSDGVAEPRTRLEIGDVVSFNGLAVSARGRGLTWRMSIGQTFTLDPVSVEISSDDNLLFDYTIEESDVGEQLDVAIFIVGDSRFHRYPALHQADMPYDDMRHFCYRVSPPLEEVD